MPPRSSWKGFLRLSLVSVPVQAINAASGGDGDVHFHQLHATCHSRIRYQKVCPIHGEVPNDEIVRGYEHVKGQYVIVDDDEIDKLRTESDRSIRIDTIVKPEAIDPAYFDGRTYYLTPDGPMATAPYAVLLAALADGNHWAIGQAVLFGREHLVAIRPQTDVLCMEILHYAGQVRTAAMVTGELQLPPVKKQELQLAKKLIAASTSKRFDLARYQDTYAERLQTLIEAKVAGREIVGAPPQEEPPVINLMDALKQSIARKEKPAKRITKRPAAKSVKKRHPAKRHTA
jgi:DNA end-binding protein Ku